MNGSRRGARSEKLFPVGLFVDLFGSFQVKPVEISVLLSQAAYDDLGYGADEFCQVPYQLLDWRTKGAGNGLAANLAGSHASPTGRRDDRRCPGKIRNILSETRLENLGAARSA